MDDGRIYIFSSGTIGAFLLFAIAIIVSGLRYAMNIIEPVITIAIVIVSIVGLIFVLLTIADKYSLHKKLDVVFSVLSTVGMIAATKFLGVGLSDYCCDNPGFGDLISFAFAALLLGALWCFSCVSWLYAISSAKNEIEGGIESVILCFGAEALGALILFLVVYVL